MKTIKKTPTARDNQAAFTWSRSLALCLLALGIGCSTEPGSEKGTGGQGGNSSAGSSVTSGSGSGGASASAGSQSGGTSLSSSSVATGGTSGSGGSVVSSSSGGSSAGAMTSGCGGGYLIVASEAPVPGALSIRVRTKGSAV